MMVDFDKEEILLLIQTLKNVEIFWGYSEVASSINKKLKKAHEAIEKIEAEDAEDRYDELIK